MEYDSGTIYDRAVCAALFNIVGSRRSRTGIVRYAEESTDNDAGGDIPDPCTVALWTVGVSVLGFLSAARLLSTMEILDAAWFTGWSCFLPYIVVALVGIGCGIWSSRSWLRSR